MSFIPTVTLPPLSVWLSMHLYPRHPVSDHLLHWASGGGGHFHHIAADISHQLLVCWISPSNVRSDVKYKSIHHLCTARITISFRSLDFKTFSSLVSLNSPHSFVAVAWQRSWRIAKDDVKKETCSKTGSLALECDEIVMPASVYHHHLISG